MQSIRRIVFLMFAVPALWGQSPAPVSLDGIWNGTLEQGTTEIPFKFGLSGSGSQVKAWFFNGDDKLQSSRGSLEKGVLTVNFDRYAAVLRLEYKDGAFDGTWTTSRSRAATPVHLARSASGTAAPATPAPSVGGVWLIENVRSSKGEQAWQLVLTQKGNDLTATILRVDGDTGALTGGWQDGKFVVSHFDGTRPALWTITPLADGTLSLNQGGRGGGAPVIAIRQDAALAQGLATPADPNEHTSVKDAAQPFPFSFPDFNGVTVSNTDARFQGKVVLINITGSWCPNCHDEAPFLAELYDKYHDKGLEIVALSFEEAEQLPDVPRLRAFVKENGINYTVLVGGETSTAKDKLVQTKNWDAWPTTFFVGRDGLVKGAHAGFPSSGSGAVGSRERKEFTARVEALLAQNAVRSAN